jgi:Zn-dependent peptidase ImmA (M78 family)
MRARTPGFVGERLSSARQARGLTATSLSELLGIHSANIHNYEHGKQSPSPQILRRLSEVLGVPTSFFLRDVPAKSKASIFYRSLSSATKAARTKAERRFEWLKELTQYLSTFVDFPDVNVPQFDLPNDVTLITTDLVHEVAQECRRFWNLGPGPIADVVMALENNGIIVCRTALDAETLDAFSQWDDQLALPFVILSSDKASAVRSRFDAAHELAHLVLHRNVHERQIRTAKLFRLIEQQAHRFAGAFLLPEREFLSEVWSPTLDTFRSLKGHWKVAIALMINRCRDLGVLSEEQVKRAWINMSRRGWRRFEPLDDQIEPEKPVLLRRAAQLLMDENLKTKDQIVVDLRLQPTDIETLLSAESGYLGSRETDHPAPRLKGKKIVEFNPRR